MRVKRIVILGCTGFIGGKLEQHFVSKLGVNSVCGLSSKDINFLEPDSPSKLSGFLQEGDAVIICSAIKRQAGNDAASHRDNMQITSNITEAVCASKVSKVVYISSCAVYGEDIARDEPITENTKPLPRSYYGLSKIHSEELLLFSLKKKTGMDILVVRPTTIYGQRDKCSYDPSGFVYQSRDEGVVQLWGDGSEQRDFVYIDDFCQVLDQLMNAGASGIINIVSGKSISFRDIIYEIQKTKTADIKLLSKERTNEKVDHCYKNMALQRWAPNFKYLCNKKIISRLANEILKEEKHEL